MGSKYPHRTGYIVVFTINCVVYAFSLVMNGLAGTGGFPPLFTNSTDVTSDTYYLDITPAGWTFIIWGFIFTWQVLWLIYTATTIFRTGIDGYMYYSPTLVPISLHIIYIINSILLVTWLILWDRAARDVTYLLPAFIIIALLPIMGAACIALSIRALDQNQVDLVENGFKYEIWLVRFLVQNGLGIYTAWVFIATQLNFAMMLHYQYDEISMYGAGWVALSIIFAGVLVYFLMDVFLWDRYTRYLFIPYGVFVWALSGCVSENYPVDMEREAPVGDRERNPYRLIDMLVLSVVLLITKLTVMLWRHFTRPEFKGQSDEGIPMSDYGNKGYVGSNPSLRNYNQKL